LLHFHVHLHVHLQVGRLESDLTVAQEAAATSKAYRVEAEARAAHAALELAVVRKELEDARQAVDREAQARQAVERQLEVGVVWVGDALTAASPSCTLLSMHRACMIAGCALPVSMF
jgi:hypothetical protein